MSDEAPGLLVHGTPKIGKSWLAESRPGPVLILDGEGSTDFPLKKAPAGSGTPSTRRPRTGPDDVVVVKATDWQTVVLVNQWLSSGQHPSTASPSTRSRSGRRSARPRSRPAPSMTPASGDSCSTRWSWSCASGVTCSITRRTALRRGHHHADRGEGEGRAEARRAGRAHPEASARSST